MAAPAVAWYGVGSNVGKVINADGDVGWGGSLSVDTVNFVEGTASLGEKVSNTTVDVETVNTTDVIGEPFDFSGGGGNDGDHLFGWLSVFAAFDTLAAGGIGIAVVDDLATDSIGRWYVGPQEGYLGGWASYVINPAADFDEVVAGTAVWTLGGNPAQLSGVDGFGAHWTTTVVITGNTDNAFLDAFSVGQGYNVTLGDAGSAEGKFSDFIAFENTVTTGRFGGLREVSGILFPKCKLSIGIVSGAGNTEFIDTGFTVAWEKQTLSDGTSSAVAAGFYELLFQQGSGTTDVTLTQGTLLAAAPHRVALNFAGINSATLTSVNVDRPDAITLDTAVVWTDSVITNAEQITAAGADFLRNTVSGYEGTADTSVLIWDVATDPNTHLDDCDYTMGTALTHAIEFGLLSPLTMTLDGNSFNGYGIDASTSAALHFKRTTGTVTLNITDGSVPTFKTDGATIVIVASVTVTLTGLQTGTEVRVYDTGDNSEIAGVESSGTSFAFADTPANDVYIRVFHVDYEPHDFVGFIIPATAANLPVNQRFDRVKI
jgi:hypothetical protein